MTRRLTIPVITGENAGGCVLRIEQYFERGKVSESEKLQAVKIFGQDLMALATIRPEKEEKGWEKNVMMGLRVKMRLGMKILEPINLKKMMGMAREVEEWNRAPKEQSESLMGEMHLIGQLTQQSV
ncbi:hypothetical protein AALP_AA4G015500 [Arabis alpina]|uniref:Uncharacterized protein n=1 Tax=Arabis alpina TaxID=50452 RepID=A0A087H0H4_ARAAL|nr:hypothetical protein AALP_AA4G015500 [Arabis alpina]